MYCQIDCTKKKLPHYTQTWWLEIWKLHGNFRSLQKLPNNESNSIIMVALDVWNHNDFCMQELNLE
jgi:hypothetical protein